MFIFLHIVKHLSVGSIYTFFSSKMYKFLFYLKIWMSHISKWKVSSTSKQWTLITAIKRDGSIVTIDCREVSIITVSASLRSQG